MSTQPQLVAQIQINSHSVRNLSSMDKKLSITVEIVDEEDLKLKIAQYLLFMPVDQVFKMTLEPVEN
jgi:hypothetical protein